MPISNFCQKPQQTPVALFSFQSENRILQRVKLCFVTQPRLSKSSSLVSSGVVTTTGHIANLFGCVFPRRIWHQAPFVLFASRKIFQKTEPDALSIEDKSTSAKAAARSLQNARIYCTNCMHLVKWALLEFRVCSTTSQTNRKFLLALCKSHVKIKCFNWFSIGLLVFCTIVCAAYSMSELSYTLRLSCDSTPCFSDLNSKETRALPVHLCHAFSGLATAAPLIVFTKLVLCFQVQIAIKVLLVHDLQRLRGVQLLILVLRSGPCSWANRSHPFSEFGPLFRLGLWLNRFR